MDRVDGSSLDQIPGQGVSDTMIRDLWTQVDTLHRARIAHRSLRAANIVADGTGRPWIVDFSFSELGATQRQMALDVAELLASLATLAGAERSVAGAASVIGADGVAAAVPLLQPLALSAGTRRAIPLDAGGPLTLQALEAGYIGVALLFTTDPSIPARHLVVLADDRGLQPAESIAPLLRKDVIARYGPNLVTVLTRVSALLDTGTLRALDARVELGGRDPGLVARGWLRAHGLIPAGGGVR